MSQNTPLDLADAIIQRLAYEVRSLQVAEGKDPRGDYLYDGKLEGALNMLIAAMQTADGERGNWDHYAEWAEAYLAETQDAHTMTDLATRTPRKGGSWRDYRPTA